MAEQTKAEKDAADKAAADAAKTVKGLKYTGTADVRRIKKALWAKAKVDDQDEVVWNAENDYTVKVSDLSKSALAVLEKDPDFKSVDVEA